MWQFDAIYVLMLRGGVSYTNALTTVKAITLCLCMFVATLCTPPPLGPPATPPPSTPPPPTPPPPPPPCLLHVYVCTYIRVHTSCFTEPDLLPAQLW